MSLHVEYANPERLAFVNELDFIEANELDFPGDDTDVLLVWYDEVVAIPVGDAAGALALAQRIVELVGRESENGRAKRVPLDESEDEPDSYYESADAKFGYPETTITEV